MQGTPIHYSNLLNAESLSAGGDDFFIRQGNDLKRVKLSANFEKRVVMLPNSMARTTSQLYNGKLYMLQSLGNTLEIFDLTTETTTIKQLPTNMYRFTISIYNGKLYMPQNGGATLEIFDLALETTTTKTLPTTMNRYTSQIYNGKLYKDIGTR